MSASVTDLPNGEIETTGNACAAPYLYVRPVCTNGPAGWTVWFEWTDTREPLDRTRTHGINTGHDRNRAKRLALATLAGAVIDSAERQIDVNGESYVQARAKVMARYLDADLRRLGF